MTDTTTMVSLYHSLQPPPSLSQQLTTVYKTSNPFHRRFRRLVVASIRCSVRTRLILWYCECLFQVLLVQITIILIWNSKMAQHRNWDWHLKLLGACTIRNFRRIIITYGTFILLWQNILFLFRALT